MQDFGMYITPDIEKTNKKIAQTQLRLMQVKDQQAILEVKLERRIKKAGTHETLFPVQILDKIVESLDKTRGEGDFSQAHKIKETQLLLNALKVEHEGLELRLARLQRKLEGKFETQFERIPQEELGAMLEKVEPLVRNNRGL